MTGWIMVLAVAVVLSTGGEIGWSRLSKEHKEARSLSFTSVDFGRLNDGIYTGTYKGGIYKWRANTVQVVVDSGRVKNIKQIHSSDPGAKNTDQDLLYNRVIKTQSLQVDVISGATLTSKAYLKAVEIALAQAQK